jgi:hypothetical protein
VVEQVAWGEDPHGWVDEVGEVAVAGDEHVGAGVEGEGDQVVVARVAAERGWMRGVVHELGAATKFVDEVIDVSEGDPVSEPIATEGAVEFGEELGADDHVEVAQPHRRMS